jgi:hypothetical protein
VSYSDVIDALGFGDSVAQCADGRIGLPLVGFVSPAEWFGCAPALVPIASNGSGPTYLGLWVDALSDRPATFVSVSVEDGRAVTEIARTSDQLFAWVAMKAIVERDGVDDEIIRFCDAVGLGIVSEFDAASLEIGDDQSKFSVLSPFRHSIPLASARNDDQYDGAFPTQSQLDNGAVIDRSPFEVMPQHRHRIICSSPSVGEPQRDFDVALTGGQLPRAWLALNSPGWPPHEAADALTRLAAVSQRETLQLLCAAWCPLAMASDIGY